MARPCFLVVDREFSANISTRKLVIETAKFNVITAYSGHEALETVKRFPAIDAVVLDTTIRDIEAPELIRQIKQLQSQLPVVLIRPSNREECPEADYNLEYFDPASLLELLQKLRPNETASIEARNKALSKEEEP
jgi:CheY-like chemotaxis protein